MRHGAISRQGSGASCPEQGRVRSTDRGWGRGGGHVMIGKIFLVMAAFACSALAQTTGRIETSIDYSYLRLHVPNSVSPVNLHGIQIGAAGNVNRWLGFGGDFGAYY